MDKITFNLEPEIDQEAVNRLRTAINGLRPGAEVTITIESADAHEADPVIALLTQSGFDYQVKGGHDGQTYHISARKKQH